MAEYVMQSQAKANEEDQTADDQAATRVVIAVSRHTQMLVARLHDVRAAQRQERAVAKQRIGRGVGLKRLFAAECGVSTTRRWAD